MNAKVYFGYKFIALYAKYGDTFGVSVCHEFPNGTPPIRWSCRGLFNSEYFVGVIQAAAPTPYGGHRPGVDARKGQQPRERPSGAARVSHASHGPHPAHALPSVPPDVPMKSGAPDMPDIRPT